MSTSAISAVRKYVIQHYGNLISVDDPEFDSTDKTWVAELKSDYPRIIHDDRSPDERFLKFLSLRRLGTIKIGENLEPLEATSRETCVNNLSCFLNMWQERAERIIVKASSDNLASINEARWVLGKIGTIISRLKLNDVILDSELDTLPVKEAVKLKRYLQLLEGLDIVSRKDEGYSYGNMFTELSLNTNNDFEKLNTAILSLIIKERYSALKETFGISQLETFVHVDSCYYRPALEAERLIYWNADSFAEHVMMFYGNKSKVHFRLPYILEELVNVKALKHEDKFYFGNDRLFKEMQTLKDEMTELASPRA
jgi:hypothetical protein